MSSAQVEAGTSAAGLLIDGTRTLFGGTRAQGLRAGTSRFLNQGWFVGWKASMAMYCIVWDAYLDRGEGLELRIYFSTWTLLIATAYFVISTISALLCMAYVARETPRPAEEGKPKPPTPEKGVRSPVPCYFRWLQHISWVLAGLSSLINMSVYWLAVYDGEEVGSEEICVTILSILMVLDEFLVASEYKIKYAWLGLYYFVVYIFFNVAYYYETTADDRLTFGVFNWEPEPGKACLWIFLILTFFIPGFSSFHYFIYRLRERMYTSYKHEIDPPAPEPAAEEKPADKAKEEKKEAKEDTPKEAKEKKKSPKEPTPPPPAPVPPPVQYWGPPPPGYPGGVQYGMPQGQMPLGPPPASAPKGGGVKAKLRDMLDVL